MPACHPYSESCASERRRFCRSAAMGGAALAIPPTLRAQSASAAPAGEDEVLAAFARHRAAHAWQLGYEGLAGDVAPIPLTMHGRIPRELQGGAFYRNGPARHALGGMRYHHLFDGDGMVQKYDLGANGVVHRGRFVRTDKFTADTLAGRPVRAAFGTMPPGAEAIGSPDTINVANTSVVWHGGELWALWEGGSATRVDPATLDTRGVKVLTPEYEGMPFSAHPKIEPDGTLWNFGVTSSRGLLSIYRIGASGQVLDATTLPVPDVAMVHDFAVTERHLVFLLPPLVFDNERAMAGQTFLDSHVWRPELGLRVLVLDKARPAPTPRWFELPAGFVFHVGNAWEESASGVIRLDCVRSPDAWSATTGMKALMRGEFERTGRPAPMLVTIDLARNTVRQELLPHESEFPRVDPHVVGRRYRYVFGALRENAGERPGFDAVMRLDVSTGRIDRYRYGAHVMVEEHIFVPRHEGRRAEGDGWVLGTALDLDRRAMLFSVFDAQRLADGPVAQGVMQRVMPLGLHAIYART